MESNTPIELLVSRVWNGTKWHYPNIERMVEENNRLRAELVAAIKQRDEARRMYLASTCSDDEIIIEMKRHQWDCFKEDSNDR